MKLNFKLKFLIALILVTLFTGIIMPFTSLATDLGTTMKEEYMNPNQFDGYNTASDKKVGGISIGGVIREGLGVILTIVRIIAVGWAIVMAVSIAMKYMTGSAQIKSQLKTDMPTYIIGAVILFGAAGILTLVQYFIEDVFVTK